MGGLPDVRILVDHLSSVILTLTSRRVFLQGFTKYESRMTLNSMRSPDDIQWRPCWRHLRLLLCMAGHTCGLSHAVRSNLHVSLRTQKLNSIRHMIGNQGPNLWRTISLGFDACATQISQVSELLYRQVSRFLPFARNDASLRQT